MKLFLNLHIQKITKLFSNNIQTNQTLILSLILFVWVYFYNLNISPWEISLTFFTVIILDFLFIKLNSGEYKIPYSWVNAWFGICFFLRSEDSIIYVFAWLLAIVWKHVFLSNQRHFMNPSNMAVFLSLVLFPQYAWVNTLQWWNYSWVVDSSYILALCCIVAFGFFMTRRVKKKFSYNYAFDLILPFFVLHSILFFTIPFYENVHGYIEFFSISFIIFTFFMMTDPKTVPEKSWSRVLYAFSMVLLFYILQFFINESYAILGALFFNTLMLPYIWKLEKETWEKLGTKLLNFYLILLVFEVWFIGYLLGIYWQPDLLFDNVCGQLFCK